jgi:hypothetical protein
MTNLTENVYVITECSLTAEIVITEFHCTVILNYFAEQFDFRVRSKILYVTRKKKENIMNRKEVFFIIQH